MESEITISMIKMEPYRFYFPHAGLLLPETERLTQHVLSLPTGTSCGPEDITKICSIIKAVTDNADAIQKRLTGGPT